MLVPAILGFGVYEINLLVDTLLASLLESGSVSYLYYANRMVQLPLGVFGVALGVAILPMLTGQAARQEIEEFRDTLAFGIRLILFITVPATVGLIILSFPIINTLWERGEFFAVHHRRHQHGFDLLFNRTLRLCWDQSIGFGLLFISGHQDPDENRDLFHAAQCHPGRHPDGPHSKHGGIALATSLSSIFNAAALVYLLRKRLGRMGGRSIVSSMAQLIIAVTLMGLGVYFANAWWFDPQASLTQRIGILFGEIVLGVDYLYLRLMVDEKRRAEIHPPPDPGKKSPASYLIFFAENTLVFSSPFPIMVLPENSNLNQGIKNAGLFWIWKEC